MQHGVLCGSDAELPIEAAIACGLVADRWGDKWLTASYLCKIDRQGGMETAGPTLRAFPLWQYREHNRRLGGSAGARGLRWGFFLGAFGVKLVSINDLATTDLYIDAIYQGGRRGNAGDDPLPKLMRVDSQGGFRYRGKVKPSESWRVKADDRASTLSKSVTRSREPAAVQDDTENVDVRLCAL